MHIQANSITMAYDDAGQGQPVLFIHGYPLSRRMWQPQLEALSGDARILALDLRGHGESQTVPGSYSVDLFADDLNALLDALHIDQPIVLCGLSMGGYVAFAFFRKYAWRLRGLILTATKATPDSEEGKAGRDQAMATDRQKGVAAVIDPMAPKLLAPATPQERPELLDQVRQIMLSISLEGMLGDLAALRDRPDSTPNLAEIDLPTLLLPGAEDQLIPRREAEMMEAGIRTAHLTAVPNAGHLLNLENPAVFNHAVREFLANLG